jgi:membrane carboxypeptidase/penicillin-binding protein PbpC
MIELTANLGSSVRWFVNDAPIPAQSDGRVFWQLTPGQWQIRAVSQSGVVTHTISVE